MANDNGSLSHTNVDYKEFACLGPLKLPAAYKSI